MNSKKQFSFKKAMPKISIRNLAASIALMSATIVITNTSSSAQPNAPTAKVAQTQLAQARLSDVSSSWAEPFIRALADRNIIIGYPDGTYRPDQPITRAEFAALLNKAFDLQPIRGSRAFRDVPANYWAASVIDRAYRAGFIAGYPNNTFGPTRNILRIESLVAFVNGSRLQPDGSTASRVDELFTDAGQIPSYGRDAIVAATQKCVAVSVSYPTNKAYDPNRIATRADVAATLHQILVAAGRIPALASDSPAQQYIVNCATAPVALSPQEIINRTSIGTPPAIVVGSQRKAPNAPAGGITTPTAFGANWGDIFVGAGYQNNLPVAIAPNGGTSTVYGGGIGVGNARQFVGVEASYTSAGNSLAERGGFNFKLHKQIGENLAIAGGWENAIRNGYNATNDPGQTYYGVVTGILPFGETSNLTASVGAGNGRFRTFNDLTLNNSNLNVFGSLGFRFSENLAVAADYNGRNFSVGLPISVRLGDSVGLQVTPALLDIAGDQNSGPTSRFGLGGGIGINF
ncbi:S-layer homology domain-containing protein [Chamaesiphon minutus]|uniref:Putative S-layer protein n=1 Tax=Chamaesiphon minutus (strain ATCC 27169 / PCC 6605) TaxID=1173020 RepID=K9UH77_CHAP6|nr:S-layer homology domain-containing protein [Chamaesiphon minutus]AFY93781.1 putative S-layer protein [Chamaesiphon minutus PCC 6605]